MSSAQSEYSAWRETQGGWTIALGPGASANIQLTKRGEVRWTLLLSGSAETIAEAQARLEEIAGRIGLGNE